MKTRTRLWLLAGLALVALIAVGLVLQGINTLYLQLSWYLPYWIVQPVFLLIFAAGALLLVQVAWPWLRSAWEARSRPAAGVKRPAPTNRRQAAAQNLAGIDQTLERVRDAVERETLQQERKRMAAELERGDLVIVLFGVGSAGKTSLIRALLQELVGKVGAAMGSTVQSQRYRLRLKGLQRGVWLVDTPGILEAGAAGLERELLAREQASKADLLLLVVDGDLRAAELEVFDALASLGKRLMLVLNKCDLRGEQEEARLLQLLRQRSRGRVAAEDVVAASAAPQSVPMPG
ncbi:50S ribosome-binding GTPase, partial [Cyanobium sp. BA20m-14]|uniref:Era-like GTP-binding protein n=1 Tax=Cyanobium sp. BA20m-14 TaxID=2823703 RepID=UPI0020CCCB2A